MEVYMVFLSLLLFAIDGEAPRSRGPTLPPPYSNNPPGPAPRSWGQTPPPLYSTNPPGPTPTESFYNDLIFPDGTSLYFYSKNLLMDFKNFEGKYFSRDGEQLSVVRNDFYTATPTPIIRQAGKDYIKLYADYYHGETNSGNGKAYKVIYDDIKLIETDAIGATYHMNTRVRTPDESRDMCCNAIVRSQRANGNEYILTCAEPACYKVYRGPDGQQRGQCFHLSYDLLESIIYRSCVKESYSGFGHNPRPVSPNPGKNSPTTRSRMPVSPAPSTRTPNHRGQMPVNPTHPTKRSTSSQNSANEVHIPNFPLGAYSIYGDRNVLATHQQASFYSKNLPMNQRDLPRKAVIIDGHPVSFTTPDNSYSAFMQMTEEDYLKEVGTKHMIAYADFWHGEVARGERMRYYSFYNRIQQTPKGSGIYQLQTRLRTIDDSLEMCCNLLILPKSMGMNSYDVGCAQPACYHIHQGNGRRQCYFLDIVGSIDKNKFQACWKD